MESNLKVIGKTTIPYENANVDVDVYEDGTFLLPNGQKAQLSPESFEIIKEKSRQRAEELLRQTSVNQPASEQIENRNWKKGSIKIDKSEQKEEKHKMFGKDKSAQKEAKKADEEDPNDIPIVEEAKRERNTKIKAIIIYVLLIAAIIVGAVMFLDGQQKQVAVARLRETVQAGDVYTTEMIEPVNMLQSEVDRLGIVSVEDETGTKKTEQTIILWNEANDKIIGKYATNYIQKGQYVTTSYVTDQVIYRNSWLQNVDQDKEVYTLPFTARGVNTRILLPGTHMRVRIVAQLDSLNTSGISVNTVADAQEETELVVDETGVLIEADTSVENTSASSQSDPNNFNVDAASGISSLPVAEIVFDDIETVDMLNDDGESIFDIYLALSKKTTAERVQYLQTTLADNDQAKEFQQRVTPSSLVLALTKEQATAMAKFENLENATIKYTILPSADDEEKSDELSVLLNTFVEISTQINNIQSETASNSSDTATK